MIAAVIGKSHETIACYRHLPRARMLDCALCLSDGMCAPADFRDPAGHVAAHTKPAVVPRASSAACAWQHRRVLRACCDTAGRYVSMSWMMCIDDDACT